LLTPCFVFYIQRKSFFDSISKLDNSFWAKVPEQDNVIVCAGKMDARIVAKK